MKIVRSFSFKLNTGNYESRDFFCSQEAECEPKDAEKTSEAIHDFCKREVLKSVVSYKLELDKQKNAKAIKVAKKDEAKEDAEIDIGVQAVEGEEGEIKLS